MAKLSIRQIHDLARSIVSKKPGGVRRSALEDEIWQQNPETPRKTIGASIWDLDKRFPREIAKPSRGLFTPADKSGAEIGVPEAIQPVSAASTRLQEQDFYESFGQWLKNDLDEATEVAPLGGAGLKSKWGTPDVIGIYKPLAGNLIKFPIEILSAEIKIVPQEPVVAFGQAIAYRLFSTKTYIAMPTSLTQEDQSRLESLCMLFGVGLALFDLNKDAPRFSIRVRAQRFSPDMFYVNEFADRLKKFDSQVFQRLFG